MAKIDIKRLDSTTANDTKATKTINDNFKALQEAIDNTVSRDGTIPNYMNTNLDLNHNRLINIAEPVEDRDAVTLKYLKNVVGDAKESVLQAKNQANRAEKASDTANVYLQQTRAAKESAEQASIRANDSAYMANDAANRASASVPLTFTNRFVSSVDWFEDYLLGPNYTYSTFLPLEGVKDTMIPFVTLPVEVAVLGTLAPIAITVEGGLYIYSQEIPQDFNIPSIVCFNTNSEPVIPDVPVEPGTGVFEIDYNNVTIVNDYGTMLFGQNDKGSYTVISGFDGATTGFWFNDAPAFGLDHSYSYQFKFKLEDGNVNSLLGTYALGNFQDESFISPSIRFNLSHNPDTNKDDLMIELVGHTDVLYRAVLYAPDLVNRWVTVEVKVNPDENRWQIYIDGPVTRYEDKATGGAELITFPLNYHLLFANNEGRTPASLSVDLEETGFKQHGEWVYRASKEIQ